MEGEPGPDWLAALLNGLGYAEYLRGAHRAARARIERALAITEAALGPDHPVVAIELNNLAEVLRVQGDLAGARRHVERALAITEAALGPDHPDVAIRLNNLASVLQDQGDLAEARQRFERALAITEAALGPDHPSVAIRLNNLALVLWEQDDLAGARREYERALAITEAALGPDHPSTRTIRDNLAALPPLEHQHSPPASLQSTVARSAPSTKSRAPARATALGEQQSLFGVRGAHPTPRSEENSMTENPGGPKYDFRGATVHGPIFNDAVFHEAVTLTHGLGAQPSQQAELAKALEALRAQLAALPAEKGAVANKAAESAKEVVEAAKPGGDESLFRGAVRSLRGWAEDIGKAVPAIGTAAEQVIKLAGQVRGWVA